MPQTHHQGRGHPQCPDGLGVCFEDAHSCPALPQEWFWCSGKMGFAALNEATQLMGPAAALWHLWPYLSILQTRGIWSTWGRFESLTMPCTGRLSYQWHMEGQLEAGGGAESPPRRLCLLQFPVASILQPARSPKVPDREPQSHNSLYWDKAMGFTCSR